jgi:tripartite-type tricarboxylate transporter receptor subunit TctC
MLRRRPLLAGLAAQAAATAAQAQSASPHPPWPQHPVRILVGFPPGGLTDVLARVLAPRLSERFGQPFVVENRAGASGIIAAEAVAKATDGHTLLLAHPTALAIAPVFARRLPFDAERDFSLVSLLALQPHLLLVKADAPWRDVAALVADARARPETLTFASSGVGSVQHIQAEQFCAAASIRAVHVPYRGSAPTMTDLAAGQVDFVIDGAGISAPLIEAGRLRALATANARRIARRPEVPTLAELGIGGVLPGSWFGLAAPAALPAPVSRALRDAAAAALPTPEVARALDNASAEGVGSRPDEFRAFVQDQIARFRELARRTSISME